MSDAQRHIDAVRSACAELLQAGQRVSFAKIAERTGISRATLYRQRELRELVDQHRHPSGETLTLTTLAAQVDQLQHTLEALAAKVRRQEEDLRRLKAATQPGRERSA